MHNEKLGGVIPFSLSAQSGESGLSQKKVKRTASFRFFKPTVFAARKKHNEFAVIDDIPQSNRIHATTKK